MLLVFCNIPFLLPYILGKAAACSFDMPMLRY